MSKLKDNIVFVISLFIVLVFALPGILYPEQFFKFATFIHDQILQKFGWAYLIASFLFLIFGIYLAAGKFGHIKLGKQHEKPQFSYFGWFSMLFAAGMGIGLIFWGVAEPMSHYLNPPEHIETESGGGRTVCNAIQFFSLGHSALGDLHHHEFMYRLFFIPARDAASDFQLFLSAYRGPHLRDSRLCD